MDVQRAFVVVGDELVELPPAVWKSGSPNLAKQQIASWQGRGPLRAYPQRLPNGERIAIYAETAKLVIAALKAGALDLLK